MLAGHASGCWLTVLGAGMPYNRRRKKFILFMVYLICGKCEFGKCKFGKYELLYSCSMVNLRVLNLLFGTNKLALNLGPVIDI